MLGTALAEVYSPDVGCATDEFGLLFLNGYRKYHWIQHSDRLDHFLKYFLKSRILKTPDYIRVCNYVSDMTPIPFFVFYMIVHRHTFSPEHKHFTFSSIMLFTSKVINGASFKK